MNHQRQTAFSRRRFCTLLAALPVAGWTAGYALADDPPVSSPPPVVAPPAVAESEDAPPKPNFEQLFPHPTGDNGYEDVVRAGDLIFRNNLLDAATDREATLTQKRAALALPETQRALATTRRGLNRQIIQSPFTDYNAGTLFPHFAPVRALARLLSLEQYVLLADGKTAQAVDNLFDGLRLGNLVKGEVLIGGLVGVAVDAIVVSALAKRLDALSARDCDRLTAGVREYMAQPDPVIDAFVNEKQMFVTSFLTELRRDPAAFAQGLAPTFEEGETLDAETAAVIAGVQRLGRDKAARDAFADAVERQFDAASAQAIASLRDPSAPPPKPPTGAERASLTYRLTQMSMPVYTQAASKFQTIRTQTQLLGVHGAIRRFRWEYNRLPETLAELTWAGDLLRDPFTGKPLLYKRIGGTTFELSSAGPLPRDDNGYYIENGKRTPVTVPPPPRIASPPPSP